MRLCTKLVGFMHVVNLGGRVQNDMHEGAQLVFPFVVGDRRSNSGAAISYGDVRPKSTPAGGTISDNRD